MLDAGHFNYLAYTVLPKSQFTIRAWDDGPVANIAKLRHRPSDVVRDSAGFVLRKDGRRVALLHQCQGGAAIST